MDEKNEGTRSVVETMQDNLERAKKLHRMLSSIDVDKTVELDDCVEEIQMAELEAAGGI